MLTKSPVLYRDKWFHTRIIAEKKGPKAEMSLRVVFIIQRQFSVFIKCVAVCPENDLELIFVPLWHIRRRDC